MKTMLVCALAILNLWATDTARAQTAADAPRLASVVGAARAEFVPITPQRVGAARQSLDQTVAVLRQHLESSGANGDDWKRFLHWADLEGQLASAETPDPDKLRQVRQRFVGNHAGLERSELLAMRDALARYAQVLEDSRNPNLRNEFETHLEGLAVPAETWLATPRDDARAAVAAHLGWLERREQAASATAAVRRAVSYPNGILSLSENVLASVIGAPVDEVGPVADTILGTQISGTGRTIGEITASVVPNDTFALFEIRMTATNYADTIGINGPVRVFQENRTDLFGWKRVMIDREGIRPLPAVSAASVSNCLKGLDTTASSRMVDRAIRRRATRKMSEQGDLADRIAEGHQSVNLKERLDREVGQRLTKEDATLQEELFDPLVRCGVFPRQFDTHSQGKMLMATLQFAAAGQLGAPCPSPGLTPEPDLGFQVHQSAVENLLAGTWAGKTIAADELADLMRRNRDKPDAESSRSSDDVDITLADDLPFKVRIHDGTIALTVRGQRYVSGNRSYPPMDVTIEYRVEQREGGLHATLVGEPTIKPPRMAEGASGKLSFREVGLRNLLKARLERELDREITYDRLSFSGRFSNLGEFRFAQVVADNGWALVGCRQERKAASRTP